MFPMPAIPLKAAVAGVVAITIAIAMFVAYGKGKAACELAHKAALAEHLQRGIEQARIIAKQDAEVSEYYERIRATTETKIVNVRQEVTREVPADCLKCSLSPDGVRLLNDYLRGVRPSTSDPAKPDGGMPTPPARDGWQFPGGSRPLGYGGSALLRLRSETQLADTSPKTP